MENLKDTRPVALEINLDNLIYNITSLRNALKKETLIMAIVKADGYGHGAITASKTFLENGADKLGVSILPEAVELRKSGIEDPILVLNYTPPSQYKKVLEYNLIQNIYSYEEAKELSKIAYNMDKVAIIHIKIDTGMGRLGFLANEKSIEDIKKISELKNIKIQGIFTHFSSSDEEDKSYTREQFKKFKWLVDTLEKDGVHIEIKHASNSAAILDMPEYDLDMVRPGIILYGHYPSDEVSHKRVNIKPAMTLKSSISNIKTVPKDTSISYNRMFTTKKESIIGTLPIGYGDGYSRRLAENTEVAINGKRVPIIGKICMDQFMVDLSDLKDVSIQDEAILFGYEKEIHPSVEEIAENLGTSNYEVICMMSRRLPRVYIKDGRLFHIVDYILD
jgi:alanine racemase